MKKKHIVITAISAVVVLITFFVIINNRKTNNIESYYAIAPALSLEEKVVIVENSNLSMDLVGFVAYPNQDQKIKGSEYFRIIDTNRFDLEGNNIFEVERFVVDNDVLGDLRILQRFDLSLTEKNKTQFILSNDLGYKLSLNRYLAEKESYFSEDLNRQVSYENIMNITAENGAGEYFTLITDIDDYQNFVWENILKQKSIEK